MIGILETVKNSRSCSADFVADWDTSSTVDDRHPEPLDERIAADRDLKKVGAAGMTVPTQVFVVRRDDEEFGVLVDAGLLRREL